MARGRTVIGGLVVMLVAIALPAMGRGAAPVNNDFAGATVVSDLPFSETVDTSNADLEADEPASSSCGTPKATVWYAFTPTSDMNVVAETSGTFRSIVSVFEGSGFPDLDEVECGGGSTASSAEFRALMGQTYFVQIGSAAKRRGLIDVSLFPSSWQEKTLHKIDVPVVTNGTNVPAVAVHGRPRASDRKFYDITLKVSDQVNRTHGILTFGLVDRDIKAELLNLPPKTRRVMVTIGYRYDTSQYQCAADSGEGSACVARSPISDPKWLTGGDGQRAELLITLLAQDGDTVLAERTIAVPFLGQIAGLP